MANDKEASACIPSPISPDCFNPGCVLPYGLTIEYVRQAMNNFIDFLGFSAVNQRTITASVNRNGTQKMKENWVYEDSSK